MKKLLLVFGLCLMFAGVNAQKVLVGWHTFDVTTAPVSNEVPDQSETGFTGILGGQVNPGYATTGGGNGTGTGNSGDGTYIENIVIYPLPTVLNSCVKMFPTDNSKRRIDFQVTNNSGATVTLGGIHFDYAYVWGADITNIKISVIHFGAMSDLSNDNTVLFENIGFASTDDKSWHSLSVSLANMSNVTLSDGQKAAFWIELPASGVAGGANVIIDNIAITDNTPTSVDSPTLSVKVKVYPNPTTDVINISAVDEDITEVVLMDLTGKAVSQCNSTEPINVSHFSKGLYILEVETSKGEVSAHKVMVK